MNCETCKERQMQGPVPAFAHQEMMARQDRTIKRLLLALIAAVMLMAASNAVWLYCWLQYDYSSEVCTVDAQDGGTANYIGTKGNIYNGENYCEETDAD